MCRALSAARFFARIRRYRYWPSKLDNVVLATLEIWILSIVHGSWMASAYILGNSKLVHTRTNLNSNGNER
jgi:hypothetical protein